ncbi:hypothetical protein [Flavobacterium sp. 270]|uniref:hypothetical protein n=1 Tax=Flavobacterium sp. 270 TaxID=2512114 RepID=UPI001066AE87|nr:hypothetical protein [Flavobacterium sp. 270]
MKKKNDSLKTRLKIANDSLHVLKGQFSWYDSEYDNVDFKKKGIKDPEKFITDGLRSKPELIPIKGVLGGTISFGQIQLLGNKYLIAYYDDGHIEGKSIYQYKLNDSGKLEFKIVGSE